MESCQQSLPVAERRQAYDLHAADVLSEFALQLEQLLISCKNLEQQIGRQQAVQRFWRDFKILKFECFRTIDDILYASKLHQLSPHASREDPITHDAVPAEEMLFFRNDLLQDGTVPHVYSFESVKHLLRVTNAVMLSPLTRKSIRIYDILRIDTMHVTGNQNPYLSN